MQEAAATTAGGAATGTQSPGSPSPSPPSSGSSPSPSSRTATSANILAWGTFGVIAYAWLFSTKLDSAPWWGPTVALVVNALPGGMIMEIVKTVVVVVVERLPLRSANK